MLLDKSGKLVREIDLRGAKEELLDNLTGMDMLLIMAAINQIIGKLETFSTKELTPEDWGDTVFEPIYDACQERGEMTRLFGVIVKQAIIMSPLLYTQEGDGWESVYTRA